MRLIGLLSWYDEHPTWLSTAVAGAARFLDVLVAVDGAYALYPGGKGRSHPAQAEAIIHTAESLDLGCLLYQPPTPWRGNEIEKRQACISFARAFAEEGDWLVIFDADYHLARCNAEALRAELAGTDLHAASYELIETLPSHAPEIARQAAEQTSWVTRTRDVYRWNPTLKVWPAHFTYSAIIDGERRGLKGTHDDVDGLDLTSIAFYHRSTDRPRARQQSQKTYYEHRDRLNIERNDLVLAEVTA